MQANHVWRQTDTLGKQIAHLRIEADTCLHARRVLLLQQKIEALQAKRALIILRAIRKGAKA